MRSQGTEVPDRAGPAKSTKRSRGKASQNDSRAREARAQADRAVEHDRVLEDKPYVRPSSLEAPAPRPGMKQRWVHVGVEGKWDSKNWARKQREGWVPRASSTVPKNFQVPRIDTGRFAGCIGVEGMILCEITLGQAKKRRDYYAEKNRVTTKAVDDDLRKTNRFVGGGFGPIKKAEQSQVVREVAGGAGAGNAQEVDLS
jgi:hypothetical protein